MQFGWVELSIGCDPPAITLVLGYHMVLLPDWFGSRRFRGFDSTLLAVNLLTP